MSDPAMIPPMVLPIRKMIKHSLHFPFQGYQSFPQNRNIDKLNPDFFKIFERSEWDST